MLKRFIFILVAGLCLSGFVLAQDTTKLVVPKKVKNRVLAMWPQTQAVPVTWTKEGAYFKASLLIMEKPAFAAHCTPCSYRVVSGIAALEVSCGIEQHVRIQTEF